MNWRIPVICLFLASCSGVRLSEYFPPGTSQKKIVSYTTGNHQSQRIDTLTPGTLNGRIAFVAPRTRKTGNKHINTQYYYFQNSAQADSTLYCFLRPDYCGYYFLNGAFYFNRKGLFVATEYGKDPETIACCFPFHRLFPSKVKTGHWYLFNQGSDFMYSYRIAGFEDVNTEGRVLSNCLKIEKCRGAFSEKKPKETIWLMKDAGFVKCQLENGDVAEIVLK